MRNRKTTTRSPVVARIRRYDFALRDRIAAGCDIAAGSRELAHREVTLRRYDERQAA